MSNLREQAIAIKFKPVAGGYVYRAPYQFGFGRTRNYLVNEAQKAELIDLVVPQRPWRRAFALTGAMMAAIMVSAAIVFSLSPHKNPQASDTVTMWALSAALIFAGLAVLRWWTLRKVQPILDRLPRTDIALTNSEMRSIGFKKMSTKMLKFILAVNAFNGVLFLTQAALARKTDFSAYTSFAVGCLTLGVAAYYGWQLIRRMKNDRVQA